MIKKNLARLLTAALCVLPIATYAGGKRFLQSRDQTVQLLFDPTDSGSVTISKQTGMHQNVAKFVGNKRYERATQLKGAIADCALSPCGSVVTLLLEDNGSHRMSAPFVAVMAHVAHVLSRRAIPTPTISIPFRWAGRSESAAPPRIALLESRALSAVGIETPLTGALLTLVTYDVTPRRRKCSIDLVKNDPRPSEDGSYAAPESTPILTAQRSRHEYNTLIQTIALRTPFGTLEPRDPLAREEPGTVYSLAGEATRTIAIFDAVEQLLQRAKATTESMHADDRPVRRALEEHALPAAKRPRNS